MAIHYGLYSDNVATFSRESGYRVILMIRFGEIINTTDNLPWPLLSKEGRHREVLIILLLQMRTFKHFFPERA